MNTYNLSVIRYDNGSKSGNSIHEFSHIELLCKDSSICEKFDKFCKDNNIERRVVVDHIIEFENGVRIRNEYPITHCLCSDYTYDEYMNRIQNSKVTD